MESQKFKKAARVRKTKAIVLTILFHGAIIGGITYGSDASDVILEKVQQVWKGENVEEIPKEKKKKSKKNRA